MKNALYGTAILLLINSLSFAQDYESSFSCAHAKATAAAKTSVDDPAEENYDVKYVKLDLQLTNQSIYITGDVTTTAVTLVPSFSSYVFELDSALTIDGVLIDGVSRTVVSSGDIHRVMLPYPFAANTTFTARVMYHGIPHVDASVFNGIGGINNVSSPTWGTKVTFTQSESYHAKEWWPCKQSLHDKIDSTDMWITVPDSMRAGSNGVLQAVTPVDAHHVRYEWKERHPIDYYLVSIAVAPYIDYSYYMHFSGSTDSMLVQNYVYPNPLTLPFFKRVIDSTGMMIDYFSQIYGRYPFWKEKYGHCMAPLGGGMEHQTMTTLGYFNGMVVSHELGHQWFGDNVTCGTWSDIFVNEGMASYTEDLFIEHFRSKALMVNDIQQKQANVMSADTGAVYDADTTNEARIFDGRLSYDKGACLLHMLRYLISDDSIFFHIYKTYQQEYKGRTGTIAGFNIAAQSVLGLTYKGIPLDTFFSEWAYRQGFPNYQVHWDQSGDDVYVRLDQTTSDPASVTFFTTPIDIVLHASTGDTLIRVNNTARSQMFHFKWHKTMSTVILDPGSWLLINVAGIVHDLHLNVSEMPFADVKIYPNPTSGNWTVQSVPENSEVTLCDVTGRVLWKANSAPSQQLTVPGEGLASGLYMLRLTGEAGDGRVFKLLKQ